jgi:multiple sugar transport system substrate-binding protein
MVRRLAVLGVAAVLLLAGCGGGAAPASSTAATATASSAAGAKVTITFLEAMSSGTLKPALEYLTSEFEKANPDVTVNLVAEANYGTLRAKTLAEIAAGAPPTIAQAYESWAANYAKNGALVPLGPFVSGAGGVSQSEQADFWPGIWKDTFLPDGKQWMWPFNKSDYVVYYNATVLKQKNLKPPTTWAEMAQECRTLTDGTKFWCFSMDPGSPAAPANGTYVWTSLIRAYGGHLYVNGQAQFASPQAVQATDYLAGLYRAGEIQLGTNYPGQTALAAGRAEFDLSTIAGYYYVKKAVGGKFDLEVAPMPAGPAGPGNTLQGTNIVMFAKATPAQQQAAWAYMKFLTEPAQQAYWAQHTGYLPVRQSAKADMQAYLQANPYQGIAADELADARGLPGVKGFSEATGKVTTALAAAIKGQPAQAALTAANQAANQVLQGGGQ